MHTESPSKAEQVRDKQIWSESSGLAGKVSRLKHPVDQADPSSDVEGAEGPRDEEQAKHAKQLLGSYRSSVRQPDWLVRQACCSAINPQLRYEQVCDSDNLGFPLEGQPLEFWDLELGHAAGEQRHQQHEDQLSRLLRPVKLVDQAYGIQLHQLVDSKQASAP
jgi:hypothetical protein